MKRSALVRILAIVLVLSMLGPVAASAAEARGSSSVLGSTAASAANPRSGFGSWIQDVVDWIRGRGGNSTPESSDSTGTTTQTMTLVEDSTTVENGDMLRASTYELTTTSDDGTSAQAETTTLKYFPVTLYNYDTTTINNAIHQTELDAGLTDTWKGLYFSGGSDLTEEGYTYSSGEPEWTSVTVSHDSTYTYPDYANTKYYWKDGDNYIFVTQLWDGKSGNSYLWTINGGDYTYTGRTLTLYHDTNAVTTDSRPYAAWNYWNKVGTDTTNTAGGDKMYTGLVQSTLDANKNIVFNVPDGGIFNDDETVKDIYTNVELPFYYDAGTGYYIFNSDEYGVYFHEDSTQGSTTAADNGRLYFDENQQYAGWYTSESDNSRFVLWAPFNDTTTYKQYMNGNSNEGYLVNWSEMDYHFGMSATVPFTMTSDGKMYEGVEESDDIEFTFSGDDDVWVFIDGQLVLDLGGIHNRLDATINFADNTITYFENNDNDTDIETGSFNDTSFSTTQKLFGNLISQDRASFAATDNHELTIYYLERGKGESNCQIKFNLPVKDTVSVQKIIDGVATVNADGKTVTTSDLSGLPEGQIAALNNLDFTFTLYKNNNPVVGETYLLLNANGQVIATPSTDANGQFVLKNGQTAKFTGTISTGGDTFYVVEDVKNGFIYTDYSYSADCAGTKADNTSLNNYTYFKTSGAYYVTDMTVSGGTLESDAVTVAGGEESEDALSFVCKNYMNASLPTPSAIPADDKVVIDYGLGVQVDLFSNDLYVGDSAEITFPGYAADSNGVYTAEYGTFTYDSTTHKITYQLNKQLTGVEVINYTLSAKASTETGTGTANVYIIPATTMYYEEDFTGLVNYTGSWNTEGSAQTVAQEPGVVGTVGDSPYGSDVAYLNDSGDSNGSSKYVSTTSAAAQFSYTFTGTGTSFYARTTNNTGYIRVVVTDIDGNTVQTVLRDTKYKNDGTLYNIPVFTTDGLPYGTYTVTVSIAKAGTTFGSDFYLDGIRVYKPLDTSDENASVAVSAYATDAEANMVNVTLRNKLISDAELDENGNPVWAEDNFVLFTDINGALTTAEQYVSIGPKEEVYLNNGQSVTFSLYDWDPNTNKLYLGIKAPTGSGTVTIGNTTLTISNTVDCYYDISSYGTVTTDVDGVKTVTFTITAGSGSLISLTNIKVTGTFEFTIINDVDIDAQGDQDIDEQDLGEEDYTEDVASDEETSEPEDIVEDVENLSYDSTEGDE